MSKQNGSKNNSKQKKQRQKEVKKGSNQVQSQPHLLKLLIKSKIVSMLSHQPRRLLSLAKKGTFHSKTIDQHLLPKLTLHNLYPQIQQLQTQSKEHHYLFEAANKELSCSMVCFRQRLQQEVGVREEGLMLEMQTQKCYKHIPPYFFQHFTDKQVISLLTKSKNQAKQQSYQLIDYDDQVQYNINQQVSYKMRLFIDFASFLKAIADLVDICCKKIKGTRAKNTIIREIIIQKSQTITILRQKQHNLTTSLQILAQIKKVKKQQKSLMSLIHVKGKIAIGEQEHQLLREFCCRKNLCNFGDIKYYVERSYHQTFNKSLQNYIGEMIRLDKNKVIEILKPKKANYVSYTPIGNRQFAGLAHKQPGISLDQSMEVDDQFQLVIKTNIQKQICNIFKLGLQKCTYSTDNICMYLRQQLHQLQLSLYSQILLNTQVKGDLLDQLVSYTLNRPNPSSLQQNILQKQLCFQQKCQILSKVPLIKYYQLLQLVSKLLIQFNRRCFSIINQLMKIVKHLEKNQVEKEEILTAYLVQIFIIGIQHANTIVGHFIIAKEVKDNQIQISDKIINIALQWQDFIDTADHKYQYLWRKLAFHLAEKPEIKFLKNKKVPSFQQLQQFVKENYQQQPSNDISQTLIQKNEIQLTLLSHIIRGKNQKINYNFYNYSKIMINKQILKKIQNELWVPISMNSNIQNSIGFILLGQNYINRQQKCSDKNMLSKSLLLQKSNMGIKKPSQQSILFIQPFPLIQSTQSSLTINSHTFRLIGVTQYIIEVVYLLFLYFDKFSFDQVTLKEERSQKILEKDRLKTVTLINKVAQAIMILVNRVKYYLNNLKDLQKKVKSFAKFLLLVYVQLEFFKALIIQLLQQNTRFQANWDSTIQKSVLEIKKTFIREIQQVINQVIKKYNSISLQKVKQSIKKLQINPKLQIKTPCQSTLQILSSLSKSLSLIQSILIQKSYVYKFFTFPWIKLYLQKINQQYSQIRKYVMKSNGSGNGKIMEIQWESKMNWKEREIQCLIMQIQEEGYAEHIKDFHLLEAELKREKQNNRNK